MLQVGAAERQPGGHVGGLTAGVQQRGVLGTDTDIVGTLGKQINEPVGTRNNRSDGVERGIQVHPDCGSRGGSSGDYGRVAIR